MKPFLTAPLLCLATALTGCGILGLPLNPDDVLGAPGVFGDADQVMTRHYPGGVTVAIEQTAGVAGPVMKAFTVSGDAPIEFFSPGSYMIDPDRVSRSDKRFAALLKEYANKLVAGMDEAHQELRVKATYTGSADSSLIRTNLVYKGEFGTVTQSFPLATQTLNVKLAPGDRITQNIELALLRAYNLKFAFEPYLPEQVRSTAVNSFAIDLSTRSGAQYRYAKVRVELVPRGPES